MPGPSPLATILLMACLAGLPVYGMAEPGKAHPTGQAGKQESEEPSPELAAETGPLLDEKRAGSIALNAHGGELLSIKLVQQEQRPHYRIKLLLDDSRVKVVHVDALSGEVR